MSEFTVPGAILHYEVFGTQGPLLLLIPGADGRGSVFHPAARLLAAHFTVVCYDRRGYSKSLLVGSQDFTNRLQTDADDAQRLILHLSSDANGMVFGTSSGAVVAQQLLASHPECVSKIVVHEPPIFSMLPEEFQQRACGLIQHIYDKYRANGTEAAMQEFTSGLSEGPDAAMMRKCMDVKRGDEIRANCQFWFEFELRQYTSAPVDLTRIGQVKDKLILVAGEDSGEGPGVGPILSMAAVLKKRVERIAGGHVGYMVNPEGFTKNIVELILN